MTTKEPQDFMPLTEVEQYIMLALSGRKLHGYGIKKMVAEETESSYKILTGTLYRNLTKMLDSGLIQECEPPRNADSDDSRRRYYTLTGLGERVLDTQLLRNRQLVADAEGLRGGVASVA